MMLQFFFVKFVNISYFYRNFFLFKIKFSKKKIFKKNLTGLWYAGNKYLHQKHFKHSLSLVF